MLQNIILEFYFDEIFVSSVCVWAWLTFPGECFQELEPVSYLIKSLLSVRTRNCKDSSETKACFQTLDVPIHDIIYIIFFHKDKGNKDGCTRSPTLRA